MSDRASERPSDRSSHRQSERDARPSETSDRPTERDERATETSLSAPVRRQKRQREEESDFTEGEEEYECEAYEEASDE